MEVRVPASKVAYNGGQAPLQCPGHLRTAPRPGLVWGRHRGSHCRIPTTPL